MARIESKILFITTSPRTPFRMIPEIELLNTHFSGKKWNTETQTAFMQLLREENFFYGEGANDPAFSARDRINRAPKALGFVKLTPIIGLTAAGLELIKTKRKEEIFLRQLLKFQLPSPYHKPTDKAATFWVLEWNTWRAMTMLDGGKVTANLKFDDFGNPMSTAQGNMADIVCEIAAQSSDEKMWHQAITNEALNWLG